MVIGDATTTQQAPVPPQPQQQQFAGATIDNIMHGIENTGTVKMNNHRKKLRQRFDIIKKLGQGTYGKVQLGINKETGQEVAIKTIKKSKIETEADLIRIRREVQIMSSVQHPNIIHIYEVFENREKMVLVMEFAAGGELYDYLSERKVLAEEEARRIFRQVSTAIYYCHKHKICHRDLKLENILLDEHGNAKIADFGLSNVFDEQRLLATFCGSPLYASPEIVKGTPYLGPEVDCWSLGVLLYTLVYGAMPFDGANFKRLVKQISMGDYFEPKKPSRASPLIREMLTVCPKRRANIETICNHWWVNEGYNESCLTLAEELANQTPVRLDVLLSLAPPSVTADQLVVAGALEPESGPSERLHKSHSLGSVIDMGGTEAERRIIDMVQAGGEAALMPSPTRTLTPSESPAQPKRKLEPTQSVENATGAARKRDKPAEEPIPEAMDVEPSTETPPAPAEETKQETNNTNISKDLEKINNMCDELLKPEKVNKKKSEEPEKPKEVAKTSEATAVKPKSDSKTPRKIFNKGKTVDLSGAIDKANNETTGKETTSKRASTERKNSLPDENLMKPGDRRKSRILETAEKFQSMNNQNNEKYKKFVIPGVSVGSFKKEFERKASISGATVGPMERKQRNSEKNVASTQPNNQEENVETKEPETIVPKEEVPEKQVPATDETIKESDSKGSVSSFSLEEARQSMENSIALLNKAKSESEKELNKVKPEVPVTSATAPSTPMDEGLSERERKLKNAREIISNAIPRLGGGSAIRRPPMTFGSAGRTQSGNLATGYSKPVRLGEMSNVTSSSNVGSEHPPPFSTSSKAASIDNDSSTKTSRAEITLKSATLPRRKPAKTEISLDLQTKQMEPSYPTQDARATPAYTASVSLTSRSNSMEPQKEYMVPIQKPPSYQRQPSSTSSYRGGTLSRQSTNESNDSDTTISQSLNTSGSVTSTQQPIKKSPREFIIPIAVEGGGIVTPRSSVEPSESTATTNSASSFASKRLGRPRKIGSLFNEEDDPIASFPSLKRHTSLSRESDTEEPRFHTMHRLRSSRPSQRKTQPENTNDSGSSGDEDDEDGFEILTAENLFSTLLSRVKALTQRVNANNDFTSNFPSSRLFDNMRQTRSPFWNHEPFGRLKIPTNITIKNHANNTNSNKIPSQISYTYTTETVETKKQTRINNGSHPWRSTLSRDLQSDIDSMFSNSGATTLPRGSKTKTKLKSNNSTKNGNKVNGASNVDYLNTNGEHEQDNREHLNNDSNNNPQDVLSDPEEVLDLGDLDLSKLRLSKKDLETLSSLTPSLSKRVQDQLLAQLPPNQAKKLYRTLSMLNNNTSNENTKIYRRAHSTSTGRDQIDKNCNISREERDSVTPTNDTSLLTPYSHRRSVSRSRYDTPETIIPTRESRSSSMSKDIISPPSDYANKSFKYSYGMGTSSKYGKYSPYSSESSGYEYDKGRLSESVSPSTYYDSLQSRSRRSPSKDYYGRPPSGCFSPPPIAADIALRRRSSQRRISRFLRPDFYDTPKEDSAFVREKLEREQETQRVLKEIRERSRERGLQPPQHTKREGSAKPEESSQDVNGLSEKEHLRHLLNSVDSNIENLENQIRRRRSMSREACFDSSANDPIKLTDKILDDLHNITLLHKSLKNSGDKLDQKNNSSREPSVAKTILTPVVEDTSKIVTKIKKSKSKSKTENVPVVESVPSSDPLRIVEESDVQTQKKESKLVRPKSYPSKDTQVLKVKKQKSSDTILDNTVVDAAEKSKNDIETERVVVLVKPKSLSTSKVVQSKEIKSSSIGNVKSDEPSVVSNKKIVVKKKVKKEQDTDSSASGVNSDSKTTTKKIRVVKKPVKSDSSSKSTSEEKTISSVSEKDTPAAAPPQTAIPVREPTPIKEKSPEKKPAKGFLNSIQQKFEKFRESTKANREAKKAILKQEEQTVPEIVPTSETSEIKSSKSLSNIKSTSSSSKPTKTDSKSKIETIVRNLKDRSVPRDSDEITESGLIKRAVSVEDMPDTFNKASVNRVLGLFKKIEKDSKGPKSTKSTSHISSLNPNSCLKSSFVSKIKKPSSSSASESLIDSSSERGVANGKVPIKYTCPDCEQEAAAAVAKRHDSETTTNEEKERKANNRKGLVLDFTKIKPSPSQKSHPSTYPNFPQTPSYENIANFTSDRSPGNCSSNMMTPSDDPDFCYDDWSSTCSDDNLVMSSSPSLSRLSRLSHTTSSYGTNDDPSNENVLDRIRRRSFFPRFNEKKPRRVSTIVGPAARDYYRDRDPPITNRSSSRSREYTRSHTTNLLPDYRTNRYSTIESPRKYYDTDLNGGLKIRNSTAYDTTSSSGTSSYNTYNPKRRVSFTNGPILTSSVSGVIDTYGTIGRKSRNYEHRPVPLLDSSSSRRETEKGLERDDVLRSSFRSTGNSTIPRSPTNNV